MIPIFKPYIPENIILDIERNLYSGKLSFGTNGREFENKISSYLNNDKFISTSSFNYALLILLSSLGLNAGDEILASPVSCLASNQPFAIKSLKIKWLDINPLTGGICVEDLKKKISIKTKAVFINYFCGYLSDIEEIFKIVKERNLPLIDDSIEAFGSEFKSLKVGNLYADATVFSFQTVRLPNTIEGGGISFKDSELFNRSILIRDYGINRSKFRDKDGEISPKCDIEFEGYGAMMPEINSIIGNGQIEIIDSLLNIQRENARIWNNVIENLDNVSNLLVSKDTQPNYWVYGILAKDKQSTLKHFRELGFYATGVHINNNIYSVFKDKSNLKGVNEFMQKFLAIPSGWWVEPAQILNTKW